MKGSWSSSSLAYTRTISDIACIPVATDPCTRRIKNDTGFTFPSQGKLDIFLRGITNPTGGAITPTLPIMSFTKYDSVKLDQSDNTSTLTF